MSANTNDVCDFIIARCVSDGGRLNVLKLQKLLYYCQAWSLALGRGRLINDRFQAWVHGPVCRLIYDRFNEEKSLYGEVLATDIRNPGASKSIAEQDQKTINQVLDTYAGFSGTQLESLTHREQPWITARGGISEFARCETEIDETEMQKYYAARLTKA